MGRDLNIYAPFFPNVRMQFSKIFVKIVHVLVFLTGYSLTNLLKVSWTAKTNSTPTRNFGIAPIESTKVSSPGFSGRIVWDLLTVLRVYTLLTMQGFAKREISLRHFGK